MFCTGNVFVKEGMDGEIDEQERGARYGQSAASEEEKAF